jgi:hypothetical protein
MRKMSSINAEFIQSAKNPFKPKGEKIKELYSVINYALQLKKEYEQSSIRRENIIIDSKSSIRLADIRKKYGHEPQKVAGSCPNLNKSSNILSRNSFINRLLGNSLFSEQEWFVCPKCGYRADGPVGDTCPTDKGGCGLTKKAYAEKTGESCG